MQVGRPWHKKLPQTAAMSAAPTAASASTLRVGLVSRVVSVIRQHAPSERETHFLKLVAKMQGKGYAADFIAQVVADVRAELARGIGAPAVDVSAVSVTPSAVPKTTSKVPSTVAPQASKVPSVVAPQTSKVPSTVAPQASKVPSVVAPQATKVVSQVPQATKVLSQVPQSKTTTTATKAPASAAQSAAQSAAFSVVAHQPSSVSSMTASECIARISVASGSSSDDSGSDAYTTDDASDFSDLVDETDDDDDTETEDDRSSIGEPAAAIASGDDDDDDKGYDIETEGEKSAFDADLFRRPNAPGKRMAQQYDWDSLEENFTKFVDNNREQRRHALGKTRVAKLMTHVIGETDQEAIDLATQRADFARAILRRKQNELLELEPRIVELVEKMRATAPRSAAFRALDDKHAALMVARQRLESTINEQQQIIDNASRLSSIRSSKKSKTSSMASSSSSSSATKQQASKASTTTTQATSSACSRRPHLSESHIQDSSAGVSRVPVFPARSQVSSATAVPKSHQ